MIDPSLVPHMNSHILNVYMLYYLQFGAMCGLFVGALVGWAACTTFADWKLSVQARRLEAQQAEGMAHD